MSHVKLVPKIRHYLEAFPKGKIYAPKSGVVSDI